MPCWLHSLMLRFMVAHSTTCRNYPMEWLSFAQLSSWIHQKGPCGGWRCTEKNHGWYPSEELIPFVLFFKMSTTFLYKPLSGWDLDPDYISAKETVMNIRVVNDSAGRGVKLANDFLKKAKTESQFQKNSSSSREFQEHSSRSERKKKKANHGFSSSQCKDLSMTDNIDMHFS